MTSEIACQISHISLAIDTPDDFECHITVETDAPGTFETFIERAGWHYSSITGDPILGPGTRCFATAHFPKAELAISLTNSMAGFIKAHGYTILRKKVEQVIYDSREVP